MVGACQQARRSSEPAEGGPSSNDLTPGSPAPRPKSAAARSIASTTPPVIAKAQEILDAHPNAELGAEFPFEIEGKRYVARFEEHDNPDADPNRPIGPHKGITVYHDD